MKLTSFTLILLCGSSLAFAGDGSLCDLAFSYKVNGTPAHDFNTSEHQTYDHEVDFLAKGTATYSGNSGVCKVDCAADPYAIMTEKGTLIHSYYYHTPVWGGQHGGATGVSPQSATTATVAGIESCIGSYCKNPTVTVGYPPVTFSFQPNVDIWATSQVWTNACPKADAGDQSCVRIHDDQTDHGFKCCPPENCTSPVAIDTTKKNGWMSAFGGPCVWFDINATGKKVCVDWPESGSGVGWLALPNKDGSITSVKQLFGSFTDQQENFHVATGSKLEGNGYTAMEEKDKPENGGNMDWSLTSVDKVFSHLCIWIDDNPRNGVVEPGECHPLSEFGITSLSTVADKVKIVDKRNNQGRLTALINDDPKWKSVDWYVQIRKH